MSHERRTDPSFDHGPPLKPAVFLLLVSLAAADRHGYAPRKDIAARSGGGITPGPVDPVSFTLAPLGLPVTALASCFAPAHRASRIAPLVAIRTE